MSHMECRRDIVRKNGYCLSLLSLVLVGLCSIQHSMAAKDVLKVGNCSDFYGSTYTEASDAPTWSHTSEKCTICNEENTKKSWLITRFLNTYNTELLDVAVTVSFTQCPKCSNQFLKVFAIREKLPENMDDDKIKQKLHTLTLLKKIENKTAAGTDETHSVQVMSRSSGFSIALLVEGACLIVKQFKVSYFYCEKASIEGVALPRTVSPASGNRTVNSSCFENSVSSGKQVFGLCSNDGEWNVVTPCLCKKGFTFGSKRCHSCQNNTYKDRIGNDSCQPCPTNSESVTQAVRCECKNGFYRFLEDKHTDACHAAPSVTNKTKKCNNIVFIIPLIAVASLLLIIILLAMFRKTLRCYRGGNRHNENNATVAQVEEPNLAFDISAFTELDDLGQRYEEHDDAYEHPYMVLNFSREPENQYQSLETTSDHVPQLPEKSQFRPSAGYPLQNKH